MPANFRKSGKRYKSKNGLVKYQQGHENSHQLLQRRFSPNDGYPGNNTKFNYEGLATPTTRTTSKHDVWKRYVELVTKQTSKS